jgi:hypothetical protein
MTSLTNRLPEQAASARAGTAEAGHSAAKGADAVLSWHATRDQVGHAFAPHAPRSFCGVPRRAEYWDWPARTRCAVCLEVVEQAGAPEPVGRVERTTHEDEGDKNVPLLTVTAGGPELPEAVYSVTLMKIEGPKSIFPQSGPNAGQEVQIFDWLFQVDEGEYEGTEIQATTSTASGPRSKMYSWITALMGGKAPAIGATFEAEDLQGFRAIATVSRTEAGWPRIENLGAFPVAPVRPAAARSVAPTAPPRQPTPLRPAGQKSKNDVPF